MIWRALVFNKCLQANGLVIQHMGRYDHKIVDDVFVRTPAWVTVHSVQTRGVDAALSCMAGRARHVLECGLPVVVVGR